MELFMNFLETDTFLIVISVVLCVLVIAFIVLLAKLFSINKKYKTFINKLGNGNNIEEDLENYMYRVERVEKQNAEIRELINSIDTNMANCIQKIGIVRYNAFKDTGSDLSFALAMLDEKNNGVVLKGIYSREMSNIYAKTVENGKSTYTISEEEQQAIQKAMENQNIYRIKE